MRRGTSPETPDRQMFRLLPGFNATLAPIYFSSRRRGARAGREGERERERGATLERAPSACRDVASEVCGSACTGRLKNVATTTIQSYSFDSMEDDGRERSRRSFLYRASRADRFPRYRAASLRIVEQLLRGMLHSEAFSRSTHLFFCRIEVHPVHGCVGCSHCVATKRSAGTFPAHLSPCVSAKDGSVLLL